VVLLDWDVVSLAQGHVTDWIQHIRGLAMGWFHRLRPAMGLPKVYVEPAGNAPSIIETCRAQGLSPVEIDSNYVSLGKDNRGLAVEPHLRSDRLKIGAHALDKRQNYRGITANHLLRQLTGYRLFDRDSFRREDDVYDAATHAALIGLGDGREEMWSKLARAA